MTDIRFRPELQDCSHTGLTTLGTGRAGAQDPGEDRRQPAHRRQQGGRRRGRGGRSAELFIGVSSAQGEQLFRLERVANWSGSHLPVGCVNDRPGSEGAVMSVTLDLDVLMAEFRRGQEVVSLQFDLTWPEQHPEQLSVLVTARSTPIVWRAPQVRPLPDCPSSRS